MGKIRILFWAVVLAELVAVGILGLSEECIDQCLGGPEAVSRYSILNPFGFEEEQDSSFAGCLAFPVEPRCERPHRFFYLVVDLLILTCLVYLFYGIFHRWFLHGSKKEKIV